MFEFGLRLCRFYFGLGRWVVSSTTSCPEISGERSTPTGRRARGTRRVEVSFYRKSISRKLRPLSDITDSDPCRGFPQKKGEDNCLSDVICIVGVISKKKTPGRVLPGPIRHFLKVSLIHRNVDSFSFEQSPGLFAHTLKDGSVFPRPPHV